MTREEVMNSYNEMFESGLDSMFGEGVSKHIEEISNEKQKAVNELSKHCVSGNLSTEKLMSELNKAEQEFIDKINKAIKECPWKVDMCGVDICRGDVLPCAECIDSGRCDTIRTMYKEAQSGKV